MWYVRKPTSQIVTTLSWLAKLPFLDDTWFNFGLRVPMPEPPIAGCEFRTFLFLIPIIRRDQELAEALRIENDPVTLLSYIGYALHTNSRLSEMLGRAFWRVYRRICICASRNADD
jgi:hypothetical protein